MLNILKKKQKNLNHKLFNDSTVKKDSIENLSKKNEYKNTIYYPSSSKE